MKTTIKIFGILALMIAFTSTVSAKKEREKVKKETTVEPFEVLEINGLFNVTLIKSDRYMLEIYAEENIHDHIKIKTKGERLIVDFEDGNKIKDFKKIDLFIKFKDLRELEGNGVLKITSGNKIKLDELNLELNGAIKCELELVVKDFVLDVSGASKLILKGDAKNCDVDVSGAGVLTAFEFVVDDCNIDISGAGTAKIHVNKTLDANLSGVAKVYYKGDPDVKSDVSFLSKLKKED